MFGISGTTGHDASKYAQDFNVTYRQMFIWIKRKLKQQL